MYNFLKKIKKIKSQQNTLISISAFVSIVSIALILIGAFFVIYSLMSHKVFDLFFIGIFFKLIFILLTIYIALQANKNLMNNFEAAKYLDNLNDDNDDTLQNAVELVE